MVQKYTFLLPAFKAKFFEEALLSIKNQTYTDFLCIVSDDCSPEDLKSIFDKTVGDDPRFTYRRNEQNMGSKSLVSHWNLLVGLCLTDFFVMASDDDVYEPKYLEEIDALIQTYPNVDMFRGKIRYIDQKGCLLMQDSLVEEMLDSLHFMECYYSRHILSCEACFCYRLSAVKKIGGYKDFPLAWFADDAQHIQLSKNGCAITPDITFSYRESDLTISQKGTDSSAVRKKITSAILFYDWYKVYCRSIEESADPQLMSKVNGFIHNRVYYLVNEYILDLNLWDFCSCCSMIDGRLGVDIKIQWHNWLMSRYCALKSRLHFLKYAKWKLGEMVRDSIHLPNSLMCNFYLLVRRDLYEKKNSKPAEQEKIIVSMTSWSKRIDNVPSVIDCILKNTIKPDKIVLNLSLEEFPNREANLPNEVVRLEQNGTIEIGWQEGNTKAFKKIIPTMKKYPNDAIISIDDDFYYPEDFIETFVEMHKRFPNNPLSGNKVWLCGAKCHCGCASLVQWKFYCDFIDKLLDDNIVKIGTDDVFYTICANLSGYRYRYVGKEFFFNMQKINSIEGISDTDISENQSKMLEYVCKKTVKLFKISVERIGSPRFKKSFTSEIHTRTYSVG